MPEAGTAALAIGVPAQRTASGSEELDDTSVLRLAVAAGSPGDPAPTAHPAPRRSRSKLVALITAAAVGLGAVVALGLDDRATHQTLDKTRQSLRETEATLTTTKADLAATKTELASTVTQLTGTKTELTTVTASLAGARKQLTAKEQDLQGVRNNLADVKSNVTVQAAQIETLKSCLNGVSIALSDIAYGDYSGAVSALQAVEVSCQKAWALF